MISTVDISLIEFTRLIDFVAKHRTLFNHDFMITIENNPNGIGIATTARLSDWQKTQVLAETDITNYNDW